MAASHQNYHPFALNSAHLPLQQLQGTSNGLPSVLCSSPPPDGISEASAFSAETQIDCGSSGTIDAHTSAGKKRKNKEGISLSFAESKTKESKARRAKRPSGSGIKEPPTAYIHVRARRGQATDSHSLAERVRRERISERMKMLQGLVPGCDRVTGKALILDEIINYVQSLQNQVEFLSMRIASMSPIMYGFGMDMDGLTDQPPALQDSMPVLPVLPPQGTANTYPLMESSTSSLLQVQDAMPFSQDNGNLVMQMGDQRQGLLSQVVFNNMCSFQ